MENQNKQTCCICGNEFEGYGNNPSPIVNREGARCCDLCNELIVLPNRLLYLKGHPVVGDTIHIINMNGEPRYKRREGVITHIDDLGQLHGTWGGLALIPNEDEFFICKL